MILYQLSFAKRRKCQCGFTLVEMLVAMAITLLMMLALARGFGYIGETVRDSRVRVELSNELRDVSVRLRDELAHCTVSLTPNLTGFDQDGYFVYYEGPLTDATPSIFRLSSDATGETVSLDSRYGDLDDYLAFTAVATGDNWFTGVVPRFVLDRKTAELNSTGYTPGVNALDPVTIRSKYAEIVYFASPEYDEASMPAAPRYTDADGDLDLGSGTAIENGFPDRIKLHRRVLLIRPDLNLASGSLPIQPIGGVNYLQPDAWSNLSTGATANLSAGADATKRWLYGLGIVHLVLIVRI